MAHYVSLRKTKSCTVIGCRKPTSPRNDFLCDRHRGFKNIAHCARESCGRLYTFKYVRNRCRCGGTIIRGEGQAA